MEKVIKIIFYICFQIIEQTSLVESIYQLNKTIGDFKFENKNQSDTLKTTNSNMKTTNSVSLRKKSKI